jgi:hydrogenase maturation protease
MTQTSQPNILILGVGNILLSDEGVGVRTIEQLERRYAFPAQIELLDGGTSGMELLPALDTRTHLFIVDAIHQEDLDPGGMISVDLSRSPGYFRNKISPHQLGLSEVLAAAEMNDALPGHITLFGIRPQSLETGLQLSEQAKLGLEEAVQAIVASLHALGIQPRPRE